LLLWWVAASGATTKERLVGLSGVVLVLVLAGTLMHPSMLGPALIVLVIPGTLAAFGLATAVADRLRRQRRTASGLSAAAVVALAALLGRTEGLWGNFSQELRWRWTPSAEERLLSATAKPVVSGAARVSGPAAASPSEWPGFRGPGRDSRQTGVRFSSDWASRPPELLWKIPCGPGWSSFAFQGGCVFTQEQRGPREMVVCYSADTGAEIWTQGLEARFDDPLGGPGPRATPTWADGRLFALGATGMLRCLNPVDGAVLWEQDIAKLAERQPPMWGFSSSPLVTGSLVIVHAGGAGNKGTLAFAAENGEPRWSAPGGDDTYSSAHLAKIGGEEWVLMLSNLGLDFLHPGSGAVRFSYPWKHTDHRALQPQWAGPESVLLPTGMGAGTRLIRLRRGGDAWSAEEVWTSRYLKPDFNDFVIHQDHLYGFDGGIFTCIRLDTGERAWKGGRYGKGQVLLLADSGLLLVLGERGEGVLLRATPQAHEELATHPLLEGKTWNHPAIVGDRLFVRNAEEAACYRLPTAPEPLGMAR
jgi:outer membrane protein assembly factor BamB